MANDSNINTTGRVNTAYSRDDLSEMDRIFVPQDLDENLEVGDFAAYKPCTLKFWRSVPSNCRLVKENIFTKDPVFIDQTGFVLVPPLFTRTILVPGPELEGIKTFKDIKCLSFDKIEIGIDLTLSMSISNPALYIRKGKHQLAQLTSIVNRLLRVYVANRKFDDLVVSECRLNLFDRNGELEAFEQTNGIKVNKVIFEKIELPERLKKLYNDAAEEEQRKKAQEVKLKAELDKANADAQIMGIKSEAEAKKISAIENAKAVASLEKINKLVDTLLGKGVPIEKIEDYLKHYIMAENGNTIFMGGNSTSSDIAMGVAAGNAYKAKKEEKGEVPKGSALKNSQFDKLIDTLILQVSLNNLTEENFKFLEKRLSTPETMNAINRFSDADRSDLFRQIMSTYGTQEIDENVHKKTR